MMRAWMLLLPLALAACGSSNPRYASCAAQVNADPEIRNLMMKYAGSATANQQIMFDPNPLRQEKMRACLRGYPVNGGVEPLRKPGYTINLF